MPPPYPVLLADIGGTYARFAVLTSTGLGRLRSGRCRRPASAPPRCPAGLSRRTENTTAALHLPRRRRARRRRRHATDQRALAVRPRRDRRRARTGSGAAGQRSLAGVLGILEEDDPADLVRIGAAVAGTGPRLVLGPGTGLGAAALIPAGDHLLIQNTEAGHVGFGRCERDDGLPWSELMPAGGRLAAETLLSGPGLVRLARAVAAARHDGRLECAAGGARSGRGRSGRKRSGPSVRAPGRPVRGRPGAGVLGDRRHLPRRRDRPRIVEVPRDGALGAAFEEEDPFREAMRAVPRFVITRPEPAIDGLAVLLRDENRFLYSGQDWRA